MKILQKASDGFAVSISKGKGHNTPIPAQAANMLHLALSRAGITRGTFVYQATGTCTNLSSHNRLVASLPPSKAPAIRVHMKCGKSHDETLSGFLTCPRNTDYEQLRRSVGRAIESLNNEAWASLSKRAEVVPDEQTVDHDYVEPPKAAAVSTAPSSAAVPAPSVIPIEREVYIPLLKEIVACSTNGVFTGEFAKDLIYAAFPKKSRHGLLMGTIWKLVRWGFVRQVAAVEDRAAWQVEESFLLNQGMSLQIQPLPIFAAPTTSPARKPGLKREGTEKLAIRTFVKRVKKKSVKKNVAIGAKSKQPPAKKARIQRSATSTPAVKKTQSSQIATPPVASSDEFTEGMVAFLELRMKRLRLQGELQQVEQEVARVTQSLSRNDLINLLLGKLN